MAVGGKPKQTLRSLRASDRGLNGAKSLAYEVPTTTQADIAATLLDDDLDCHNKFLRLEHYSKLHNFESDPDSVTLYCTIDPKYTFRISIPEMANPEEESRCRETIRTLEDSNIERFCSECWIFNCPAVKDHLANRPPFFLSVSDEIEIEDGIYDANKNLQKARGEGRKQITAAIEAAGEELKERNKAWLVEHRQKMREAARPVWKDGVRDSAKTMLQDLLQGISEPLVRQLTETTGLTEPECRRALLATKSSIQFAADWLYEGKAAAAPPKLSNPSSPVDGVYSSTFNISPLLEAKIELELWKREHEYRLQLLKHSLPRNWIYKPEKQQLKSEARIEVSARGLDGQELRAEVSKLWQERKKEMIKGWWDEWKSAIKMLEKEQPPASLLSAAMDGDDLASHGDPNENPGHVQVMPENSETGLTAATKATKLDDTASTRTDEKLFELQAAGKDIHPEAELSALEELAAGIEPDVGMASDAGNGSKPENNAEDDVKDAMSQTMKRKLESQDKMAKKKSRVGNDVHSD